MPPSNIIGLRLDGKYPDGKDGVWCETSTGQKFR